MPFKDHTLSVPPGMKTDAFLLRPILETDAKLDYDAVMESREFLRKWEQSSWPEDDFTVEANRKDMRKMRKRHLSREAFGYTMMNLSETQCLGCDYIFPNNANMYAKAKITSLDGSQWMDVSAAVYFWVRKSRLADALDRDLLGALSAWLEQDWNYKSHVFVTNEQFEQQVTMFESTDLKLEFHIKHPTDEAKSLAYCNANTTE